MLALHQARDRLVAERTALINQLRALLFKRGVALAQHRRSIAAWANTFFADESADPAQAASASASAGR